MAKKRTAKKKRTTRRKGIRVVGLTPVAERALHARVDRLLEKSGKSIRRCRPESRAFPSLGRYYTIDLATGRVERRDIDLAEYARSLGVLADDEHFDAPAPGSDTTGGR